MSLSLDALNHDILICIFIALSIPEILLLRQVSKRLYFVSEQHTVWKTVCTNEILKNGIPFPKRPLASFSPEDLKKQTLHAYKLGLNWRSPRTTLRHVLSTPVNSNPGSIIDIRFLYRWGRSWIITTTVGIWWTLCVNDCDSLEVVAKWSPQKALFNGIAINSDDQSDATIAISVHRPLYNTVELLTIVKDDVGCITIQPERTLETSNKPIALNGDIIVLCDHDSETTILNWKTQEQAVLKSPNTWQDKPWHVAFINGNILVVRARSICIFEEPQMVSPGDNLNVVLPRVTTSFGWVDGVALVLGPATPFCPFGFSQLPLSLLVRNKGGDPWRPTERFQFMALNADFNPPNDNFVRDTSLLDQQSLTLPFRLVSSLSSHYRGPLRCSDMVLGSYGTAAWVQPSEWAAVGLVADNFAEQMFTSKSRETLVVALFPGLLSQGSSEAHVKVALENDGHDWSCMDYDETQGLIALGSGSGEVSVYRL